MSRPVAVPVESAWRFLTTSAKTREREGRPRWCLVRTSLGAPYVTVCGMVRSVTAAEMLVVSVRADAICRQCLTLAQRREDFPRATLQLTN